jgi:hypothetical protein
VPNTVRVIASANTHAAGRKLNLIEGSTPESESAGKAAKTRRANDINHPKRFTTPVVLAQADFRAELQRDQIHRNGQLPRDYVHNCSNP